MDPKSASSLDPKLKEVYDRVMGTANPQSSPPPQTMPSPNVVVPSAPSSPTTPPILQTNTLSSSPFPDTKSVPDQSAITPKPTPASPPPAAPPVTPSPTNTSPVPPVNSSTIPQVPAHTAPTSPMGRPMVDYAALAAKYATPTPPVGSMSTSHPVAVTPSSTTYGVVNADPTKSVVEKEKNSGGSSKKKILLIVGIPLLLIAYAVIWIFIFHVDIVSFLPLPK